MARVRGQDGKLVKTFFLIPAPAARPEPRLVDELADLEAA